MERLKRWREARGLSQTKLAARADVNPATVNQIEGGKRTASPATLHKLADALDVSLYELLEGNPSPKAQRRSSPEPSPFNSDKDERRSSRFAEAIFATADKCVDTMTAPDTDPSTAAGTVDALLALQESVLAPLNDDAVRQALTNEEGDEILAVAGRLIEAATIGIQRLEEAAKDADQEEDAKKMREQIREMTRRISA